MIDFYEADLKVVYMSSTHNSLAVPQSNDRTFYRNWEMKSLLK